MPRPPAVQVLVALLVRVTTINVAADLTAVGESFACLLPARGRLCVHESQPWSALRNREILRRRGLHVLFRAVCDD